MAVETEIKLAVTNVEEARHRLARAGFRLLHGRVFEANDILDHAGDLRGRGELLRLRRTGHNYTLTYKGPVQGTVHRSREEIEATTEQGEELETILSRIGFVRTLRYEKFRTEFENGSEGIAMLDETPMGVFVELEGSAEWIDETAAQMGFSPADYITLSYIALWSKHCETAGREFGDMVMPVNS